VPGSPDAGSSDAALSSVLPGSVPEAFLTKIGRTLVCSTCVSPTSNASAPHAEHNVLSEEFEFSLACSGGIVAVLEAKLNSVSSTVCIAAPQSCLLTAIHSVHNRYTALHVSFIEVNVYHI
jgi:hypothetical protein